MNDYEYMHLALQEAVKGAGRTSPNPCVGAVIVKAGKVVAKGYHKKAGTPHAEVHALRKAGRDASGATLYVTLEPCSHMGRTPPCSEAVVKSGIRRVVVGMEDPNPLVNGNGIRYLTDHGVEVSTGILADECRSINEPFLKFIKTGLPLVIVKAGISLDGRLNYQRGTSGWITGPQSLEKVHRMRNIFDAILVGSATVKIDNPSLTTRLEDGSGRDPVRIVLDSHLSIGPDARIFHQTSPAPTWVFCCRDTLSSKIEAIEETGARVFQVNSDNSGFPDLKEVLIRLGEEHITSVLVEGGGRIHTSFLQKGLADKACLFCAPLFAGSKGDALASGLVIDERQKAIRLSRVKYTQLGEDILIEGDIEYPAEIKSA